MKICNSLLLSSLLLAGSAGATSVPDDSEAILKVSDHLAQQFESGDARNMAPYYTSDAVVLPPSSEILSTSGDITNYWQYLIEVGVTEYDVYPVELRIEGNRAYQTALWQAVRTTMNGERIEMEGNISNILEKQADGNWKIRLQSWN